MLGEQEAQLYLSLGRDVERHQLLELFPRQLWLQMDIDGHLLFELGDERLDSGIIIAGQSQDWQLAIQRRLRIGCRRAHQSDTDATVCQFLGQDTGIVAVIEQQRTAVRGKQSLGACA